MHSVGGVGQGAAAKGAALARRSRWAISFADLSLLLLGFFVLLQANSSRQQDIINGVAQQFGAPVGPSDRIAAAKLFQPGEALLTPEGQAQLTAVAHRYADGGQMVEIRSIGLDRGVHRFDGWDLAAARLGAVARALASAGIARERIIVRGLDQEDQGEAGQTLILSAKSPESGQKSLETTINKVR
ncbi:MAG: flagellar motor protein [Sphingobium sp.]|nr:flagellar motor protein [Sphingobium sp.]